MSEYRKRSTKRKKRKEATLVGDLFKILFAVSMLIVAILVAFFVFKNVSGFQLPNLKVTETSVSETPVVVSIAQKEETTAETSAAVAVTESAEVSSEAAASEEAEVEKKIESVEASVEESVKSSEEKKESEDGALKETNNAQETKESKHADKVEELPSKETEKGPTPGVGSQGEVSNGPVAGADSEKEGPVMPEKDGAIISEVGPVAG